MTSLEEVDPADEPRSFRVQPAWERIDRPGRPGRSCTSCSPSSCCCALPLAIGIENSNSTTIGTVVTCVPTSDIAGCAKGEPVVARRPPGPAAGRQDRRLRRPAGAHLEPVRLGDPAAAAPDSTVTVTIQRGSAEFTKTVTLAKTRDPRQAQVRSSASPRPPSSSAPARCGQSRYAGSMFSQAVTGTVDVVRSLPSARSRTCSPRTGPARGAGRSPASSASARSPARWWPPRSGGRPRRRWSC